VHGALIAAPRAGDQQRGAERERADFAARG